MNKNLWCKYENEMADGSRGIFNNFSNFLLIITRVKIFHKEILKEVIRCSWAFVPRFISWCRVKLGTVQLK